MPSRTLIFFHNPYNLYFLAFLLPALFHWWEMKQYTIAPSVPIRCSPIVICLVWENKGMPSDTHWSCVVLMLNCCSPDFLCSFCCSCCFSSEAYTSKAASGRKSNHGLLLRWAENPPATLRATTRSFPVGAILRTQHWSIALSSSFMVKGQQSTLPAVSPPSLPPAHCTPEVATAADGIQPIFFLPKGSLTSHWPTGASRYCAHPRSDLTSLKRGMQKTSSLRKVLMDHNKIQAASEAVSMPFNIFVKGEISIKI